MFVDAIERIDLFTRPMHSIVRLYGHGEVVPGSATLFFVNDEGCAITCKHVAELIVNADAIYQNYRRFQSEKGSLARDKNGANQIRQLEEKYNLRAESMIRIRNSFHNCFDQFSEITIDMHPTYDLALLHFKNYNRKLYPAHAIFARDSSFIKPGRSLCRLGYPFPEFTNFRYNAQTDDIEWTEAEGFPLAGTYVGPQAVLEGVFMRLGEIGDHWSVGPEQYVADGDTVVALGAYTWKHNDTGEPGTAKFAHVWTIRDGKIAALQQHVDTVKVLELS